MCDSEEKKKKSKGRGERERERDTCVIVLVNCGSQKEHKGYSLGVTGESWLAGIWSFKVTSSLVYLLWFKVFGEDQMIYNNI